MKKYLNEKIKKYIRSYDLHGEVLFRVCIADGKGGQIRKQGFKDEIAAQMFASQETMKVLQNVKMLAGAKEKISFGKYADEWLKDKVANGLSESSRFTYEDTIERRLRPFFGLMKLEKIEKQNLRDFINHLREKGISSYLVKQAVEQFKAIMRKAESDDLAPPNGLNLVPTPKHYRREPKFWDEKQSDFFLNTTKNHKLNDLWTIALATGMRAGEIAGLNWDCIHFDQKMGSFEGGCIDIRRIYNQKTRKIQEHTKNKNRRVIPMLPEVRNILLQRYATKRGEFVFGDDEPLDCSHFNRQLQSAIKKLKYAQLPMINFHSLRHSFCSRLDSSGVPRRIVSQILGHRDMNTTNKYSHLNDRMLGNEIFQWLNNQNQQKSSKLEIVAG